MTINIKKPIVDYVILPNIGILTVILLSNIKFKLNTYIYQNNIIYIDYWFFIHILNSNLLVLLYPYYLSRVKYSAFIFGWEILENLIVPSISNKLFYFREDPRNTFGDIIAAIPALCVLTKLNKIKIK